MLLKKIDLLGFKSFCDKTNIQFQPGVTAVVGPNGCGKSNIADAILWVLGEQSAKTLRGEKMEDVIFNGTENRKSLGLSEVNLTIGEIATGQLTGNFSEYQEITITRRLYRSGESDYLINKIPCRLKDIRDLLIDTGAGAKGHTIIEQGKVDEILNSSPARRREIIEETAGISKYKIRRNEALRKLDSTQQNLVRVRDIMSEVKKQMNSLDRQARKAERYQVIYKEMRELELALSVYEGRILQSTAIEVRKEFSDFETKGIGLETQLTQMEMEIERLRINIIEKESDLNKLIQNINEKEGNLQKQEGRISLLETQVIEWKEQGRLALEEKGTYQSYLSELKNKIEDLIKEEEILKLELEEKEAHLKEMESEDQSLFENVNRHRLEYESSNTDLTRLITDVGALSARIATQASRREEILKRLENVSSERSEVHQHFLTSKGLEEEEYKKSVQLEETINTNLLTQSKLDEQINNFKMELQQSAESLSQKKENLHSSRARLESLINLQKNRAGYLTGIKALLKGKESGELHADIVGCLADFIEVQPQFEKAIESVLNERLQGIMVNSPEESANLIQYLKDKTLGKGLFILKEPRESNATAWDEVNENVFGRANLKVTAKPGFESVVDSLLERVIVVKDLATAIRHWEENRGPYTFVTLDGEVIDDSGVIWGGSKENESEGLLHRQREIRERQNDVRQLKEEISRLEEAQSQLQLKLNLLADQRKTLDQSLHQIEIEKATQIKQIEKYKHDYERLGAREIQLQQELEQGNESISLIEKEFQLLQDENHSKEALKSELEVRMSGLKETLRESMAMKDELVIQLTEIKIEVNTLKSKVGHVRSNLQGLENSKSETQLKIESKEESFIGLENKEKMALQEKESILHSIEAGIRELDQIKVGKVRLAEEIGELATYLRTREDSFRIIRKEIDETVKKKNELDVKWTEIRIKTEHLDQFIQTHYQKGLVEAMESNYPELDIENAKSSLLELKEKIEQIGPVNVTAIDEFKELDERFKFLSSQEGDLTQSVDSLQEVIQKINKTTRTLFNETFITLNQKFMEVFVSFFEGGKAEMILLDEGNPFESGVDIIVQPPGKKVRNVSMLSGGEKALTAIALLFASFLIHPSPFCILDEIDAPLDEENIRRFTTVLRKMALHSQFIVITHNKRTMEMADILYGVTQEEPGISKLISVRMNQAKSTGDLQPVTS
ncbi:MAG: chromosome segregation protein SMC [Nitrospiria bacterium]